MLTINGPGFAHDRFMQDEPVNILLVDDSANNLVALSAILDRADYNLVTAMSGSDALSKLLREDFALVLLDVMMPDMDGFEVATQMKKTDRTRFIPIIFVTAVAKDLKEIYRGYKVGAVDYIQKPIEPEIVRAKVEVFVDLFLKQREIRRQGELIRDSERAQSLEREQKARIRAQQAEIRFRNLVNSLDHAVIWEANTDLTEFSFVSERAHSLLGYPHSQWFQELGFFMNHVHLDDKSVVERTIARAQKNAGVDPLGQRCEHRMIASDGSERWFHTGIEDERDSEGTLLRLRGLSVDINPLKGVEGALRDSQERLDLALNAAKMGMWDWNLITGSLVWSETMKKIWAYELGEFSGKIESFWNRVHPDDRARVQKAIDGAFDEDQDYDVEFRVVWPDKSEHWIHTKGRAFRDSNSKVVRMSGTGVEVTERKKMEQELHQLMEDLREAVRAREEIVAIVAHDLRNPLSAIDLGANILLRTVKKEQDKAVYLQAERIKIAVGRALRLSQDILDVTKVESGRFLVEPHEEDVGDLASEAIELMSHVASEKKIQLNLESPPVGSKLFCDFEQALRVFSNLIGNAIKFTPEQGSITVQAKNEGPFVLFSVSDTGPGIDREEIPFLFDRFWQAKRITKKGVGLGLFIAKGIVEAHGGNIWVESLPDHGSTFFFTLPATQEVFFNRVKAA